MGVHIILLYGITISTYTVLPLMKRWETQPTLVTRGDRDSARLVELVAIAQNAAEPSSLPLYHSFIEILQGAKNNTVTGIFYIMNSTKMVAKYLHTTKASPGIRIVWKAQHWNVCGAHHIPYHFRVQIAKFSGYSKFIMFQVSQNINHRKICL